MNTILKRIISLVLCLVMVVGYVPVNAFADETGEAVSTEAPEVTPDAPAVVTDEESEPEIPEAPKPEAPKPETPKPEAPKPEAPKPEAPKPEAPKPEAPKPEAPKPEAPKPEAPKPEAPKTEPEEPEAPKTEQEEPPVTEEIVPSVIAVTGITLDQTALEVTVGELPMTLTATVQPEDATDKTVTWTSSEPGVASVENGVLTFGYMGEAVITATAGEFSASCTVTVGEGEAVTFLPEKFVDAAIFFSDLHAGKSSNYNYKLTYKESIINDVMNAAKDTGMPFSSVTSVGDLFAVNGNEQTGANDSTYLTPEQADKDIIGGYIQNVLGDDVAVNYAWSDHDRSSDIPNISGLVYGDNGTADTIADDANYYIYTISMSDMSTSTRYGVTPTFEESKLKDFTDTMARLDPSKPVFIASHQPLHAKRGDNHNAYKWFEVINAAAEKHDIIFFWGHNHNKDESRFYYYGVGDNMTVQNGSSTKTAEGINFSHICTGYLDPTTKNADGQTRTGTVLVVEILENSIEVTTYDDEGVYDDTNALDVSIERQHEDDTQSGGNQGGSEGGNETPEETVIPEGYALARIEVVNQGTTKYLLNDALDTENLVVEAVYTKENAADVRVPLALQTAENADGYTISGFDMSKAGKQYVTVTYNGFTGSYAIEVFKTRFENQSGTVAVDFTNLGITSVAITEEPKEVEGYTAYVTYDITPVGYTQGDEATVTIALDTSLFDVTRPVKVLDQGNVIATPAIVDGKITFTTNHFSEYDVAQTDDTGADVDSTKWKEVVPASGGTTTYTYSRVNSITPNGEYVIVADNSEYALDYTITENFLGNTTVSMTSDTVDISNNGSSMTSSSALTLWKFSGSSGSITISNGDYTLGYASSMGIGSNRSAYVQSGNSNNFIIKRRSSNTGYALYYNNGWTTSGKNTAQYVRLYQLTNSESVGGTGATYAQAVGPTTYQVALGTSEADALAAVKNGMTVYTANADNATTGTLVLDNNSNLTWTWASTYNPNTAGDYAVTIKYNNVELATVTVKVLARIAQSVTLNKNEGTVERESGADAATGAYLNVTWQDGTTEQIPVVVGMLSGSYNVNKNGSYTGLTISYGGETFENFTLNVVNKSGLDDYPVYPNPGSIDLKKSATGVDFQNTGIARVELSTSGLPSEKGVDVVIVFDTSSSMTDPITGSSTTRFQIMKESLQDMLTTFRKANPTTGIVPDIDIAIIDFNGFNASSSKSAVIDNASLDDQYRTTTDNAKVYTVNGSAQLIKNLNGGLTANHFMKNTAIDPATMAAKFVKPESGTNYDGAFENTYNLLKAKQEANAAAGETREQFVIFMSDGASFRYNGFMTGNSGNRDYFNDWLSGKWASVDALKSAITNRNDPNYVADYHDGAADLAYLYMGNGNTHPHRMAEAIKGDPSQNFEVVLNTNVKDSDGDYLYTRKGLGAKIYSIGFCMQDDTVNGSTVTEATLREVIRVLSSGEGYYVENTTNKTQLTNAFNEIASQISMAASNARFVDQMGDSFNLQLNPTIKTNASGSTGTRTTNTDITITTRPVYTKDQVGKTVDGHTVTTDDIGKPYGNGTTVETVKFTVTNGVTTATTSVGGYTIPDGNGGTQTVTANSTNILVGNVIYGKNFFYNNNNAAVNIKLANGSTYSLPGETFYWNIGTINETLYTISYTVYLEGSLDGAAPPSDSYDTNNFAILYYTNHVGNEVSKSVASPSLAWLGANVSYAFYLVNDEGTPVHADGTVAQNFLLSHKITQPVVYKSELLLNNAPVTLSAQALAVLPSGYELFDNTATYTVQVGSGDGQGSNVSHWQITGNSELPATTYVVGFDGANDYSKEQYVSDTSYDYTHTTVYFAVKWVIGAVQDTVVIDYGLPVDINVMYNDMFGNAGTLYAVGPRDTKPATHSTALATGFNTTSVTGTYGTAALNNGKIRYTLNDMQIKGAEKLAYAVDYKGSSNAGFYYGDLTVIPATTVYYEDEYVTLKTYTRPDTTTTNYTSVDGWPTDSVAASGVQAEDRPGSFNLDIIDANNIYGFDQAYEKMSTHSMGNSAMIHVDAKQYGTAEFSFWGTGFDVISTTSNTTGTMVVQIYDSSNKLFKSSAVDTYYGYTYGLYTVTYQKNADGIWVLTNVGDASTDVDSAQTKQEITSGVPNEDGTVTGLSYTWKPVTNDPNALYQVPVIQHSGLPYGNYKVKITALYYETFDATTVPGYDLYLDAIRIYNPAGTGTEVISTNNNKNTTIADIYAQDGEAWPEYHELRNLIIKAETFDSLGAEDEVEGIIFIDGDATLGEGSTVTGNAITDYTNFGPNNELYLAKDQAVAFNMNLGDTTTHPGYVPVVRIGLKTVGGETAVAEMWNAVASNGTVTRYNAISDELKTATDMYYDITVLNGRTVVIKNSGEAGSILSITNIKLTYKPTTTSTAGINEANTVTEPDIPNGRMFTISRSAANAALMTLAEPQVEIPETPAPEETVPETSVPEETVPEETKPVKPDSSDLKDAVDAAKDLKEKDYTKDSYKAVKSALKAAEKVLKDKKASQSKIEAALEALNDAIAALEAKPDNSELKAAVKDAKKLKEKDYTKDSYKAVKSALKAAEKVLKDKKASQSEINEALAELNEAVDSLETAASKAKPGKKK